MIQTIEQAIKPHDKYQIEIKLDYELLEAKQTRYKIATYIFAPRSLGINQNTYSKADFYRDIQNYIRLKTPPLILRDFTENSTSPLRKIYKLVTVENWATNPTCQESIINNFKLLSAMLKSALRDHLLLITQRISQAPPDSKIHLLVGNLLEEFLTETERITQKYRALYPNFNLPNIDPRIFAAYQLTDESLSLLIEENAAELYQFVSLHFSEKKGDSFKQHLKEHMRQETTHRRAHGYDSILNASDDNETYAFRHSVLKKYASSALHLSTTMRREGRELEQIFFALAAGISMVFATVVAFYFQYQFGNFTFPFFVALVVGYMFKDRIKEGSRALFAKYIQDRLYDRRIEIRTQNGKHRLGVLKEKVAFVQEKDVPRPVFRARNRDFITSVDNDGRAENIICYTKEIVLYPNAFKQVFADLPQMTGLNDIIRYDIRAFLRKMDEPIHERLYLNDNELQAVHCHKVYHLNLISRYLSYEPVKDKLHKRIRLILDRDGIKRVEHVTV
jgi:hypothetical protein